MLKQKLEEEMLFKDPLIATLTNKGKVDTDEVVKLKQ